MAGRKKVTTGTNLRSTDTDPLRSQLEEIFESYPEGIEAAYKFLSTPSDLPYISIGNGADIWRVRRTVIDMYVGGLTKRVELCTTKKKSELRDR